MKPVNKIPILPIALASGIALGVAIKNVAIGTATGIAIYVLICYVIKRKENNEL